MMIRTLAAIALLGANLCLAPAAQAQEANLPALTEAFAAARAENWDGALAKARQAGVLGFDLVEWQRLRAGEGSFADYADFSGRRGNWPGMALLRKKGEATLADASAAAVVAYFGAKAPQTGEGAIALVDALLALGRKTQAAQVAEAAWRDLELSDEEHAAFLAKHEALLAPHHGGRMQVMLDRGDLSDARRLVDLVTSGTQAVAKARLALQGRQDGVDALITAIPERMLGSYGLARDRAVWRWRKSFEDGAADILLERSASADTLGDPELWADVRKRMARWDLRRGDARRAYKIAARHRLTSRGGDYIELEWLAGFAALKLGDAPTAAKHFAAMQGQATIPTTISRAAYWLARANERAGNGASAQAAYQTAAQHVETFYGRLAAEKLNLTEPNHFAAEVAVPNWRQAGFAGSTVFAAAQLLQQAGEDALAERFILHLDEGLTRADTEALVGLAVEWGNAHLMLTLAKRASFEGKDLMAALYPMPTFATSDLGVPAELALAIARQESEFDYRAVSYVGARGLMQLMPETAKMMAAEQGVAYDLARLTEDPHYNAQLGGAYLKGLRDEFGASPLLIAAGYNAGPGRPRRWIEEMGDPRKGAVDLAEWVEMIPFDETRNYVQRVSEAMPMYRQRLGGAPKRFSDELRGR